MFTRKTQFFHIDIQQIVSISTDSAHVMSKLAEIMNLEWDPCFIHCFNKCIEEFIESSEGILYLLKKANISRKKELFVSFLKHNNAPICNIKKYTKTRWMTCYETIESIVILENIIYQYTTQFNDALFTEEEISIAKNILPYMKMLNEAYEFLLSQEDSLFSSVFLKSLAQLLK